MCRLSSSGPAVRSSSPTRASITAKPSAIASIRPPSLSRNIPMRLDADRALPPGARVFVAGGDTLLGAALLERLRDTDAEVVGAPPVTPDLTDAVQVEDFLAEV